MSFNITNIVVSSASKSLLNEIGSLVDNRSPNSAIWPVELNLLTENFGIPPVSRLNNIHK